MNDQTQPCAGFGFLTDADLVEAVRRDWITSCQADADAAWNGAQSQIQSSSIDLHAEGFFTPDSLGVGEATRDVTLKAGEAVVYYTKERLKLPPDVMGFVFAPTQLSLKGFFSPSIGHIDPGFEGPLRQVGINMGRGELQLDTTIKVATVVLFKLHSECAADHRMRNGDFNENDAIKRTREIAPRFASDFGDFRRQAKEVSEEVAKEESGSTKASVDAKLATAQSANETKVGAAVANFDAKLSNMDAKLTNAQNSVWKPIVAALIIVPLMTFGIQAVAECITGLSALKERVTSLETTAKSTAGIDDLKARIIKLETLETNAVDGAKTQQSPVHPAMNLPTVGGAPGTKGQPH